MSRVYTILVDVEPDNQYYKMEVLAENGAEAIANTMQYLITGSSVIPLVTGVQIVGEEKGNNYGVLASKLQNCRLT